jgi:hypothetical protein
LFAAARFAAVASGEASAVSDVSGGLETTSVELVELVELVGLPVLASGAAVRATSLTGGAWSGRLALSGFLVQPARAIVKEKKSPKALVLFLFRIKLPI